MIGQIVKFPFEILFRLVRFLGGIIKLVFGVAGGILRFCFSNIVGAVIGAAIGIFLGKKYFGPKGSNGTKE
jgi:hypothetical protein